MFDCLSADLSREMDEILSDLLVRSEAESVFLCNRGGYILAQAAIREYEHRENIAALAAGSFFATREIAALVGEPEFHCVFHQGDNKGLFMLNTGMDMLLVVVFGRQSNPGLVKLCTEETARAVDACLSRQPDPAALEARLQRVDFNLDEHADVFRTVS